MKKRLISLLLVITLWELLAISNWINPMFMPKPLETFTEGCRLLWEKKILLDLVYSMLRILSGICLAVSIGVPVGILIAYFGRFYGYVECILDFCRSIPPILIFPLSLLIFGLGEESRIAVIFFGCVPTMILNASMGVVNGNMVRVNVAKIMGATWRQVLLRVVIFDALPQIFIGIRVALSMGIIVGVVTEMLVGTKHGVGSRVVYAQTAYDTPEMYFTIIIVGFLGYLTNNLLIVLERRTLHWKEYG